MLDDIRDVPLERRRPQDPDYARRLATSWERIRGEEAWIDFCSEVDRAIDEIHREWERGGSTASELRLTAQRLRKLKKVPEFAIKRAAETEWKQRVIESWRRNG